MSFAHLHVHTAYSLLDGEGTIPKIIDRAKSLGQTAHAGQPRQGTRQYIRFKLYSVVVDSRHARRFRVAANSIKAATIGSMFEQERKRNT